MSRCVATANCLLTWQLPPGDNELLDFLQCPVLAVAQRHRDVAERVLEIVLASLDEPRKPKPGLTRIKRNLYRRGVLSRS